MEWMMDSRHWRRRMKLSGDVSMLAYQAYSYSKYVLLLGDELDET
jgi:hypothetical protein